MHYEQYQLKNKANVILVAQKDTASATVMIMYPVGSRYETEKMRGVSHYIEHLMFKGTKKRNTIAGKLYDYPECCIEQYSKETPQHIKSKYSTYQFYKNLHAIEKKFYLMPYTPCSLKCKRSIELQKKYSVALKKTSPSFYQHLNEANPYQTDIIIESENDILANEKSIWKQKDGHDYVVLSTRPYQSKHWFYNILSKKKYAIGTVLSATIIHHTTYADIILGKEKGIILDLQHYRNLPLLKRKY